LTIEIAEIVGLVRAIIHKRRNAFGKSGFQLTAEVEKFVSGHIILGKINSGSLDHRFVVSQDKCIGGQAYSIQIALSIRGRDKRGLVECLRGVDQELIAKIIIERFKILLVIGPVATELDNIGGIISR
jgi:hypothetical protein